MSVKLRNLFLGLYLLFIVALLIGAWAKRSAIVDIHLHDTYWVMDGLIILVPFALMLSLLLAIHLLAHRLLRYPLLNGLHALGTLLMIGLILILAFRAGLFSQEDIGRSYIDLSDHYSLLFLTLKTLCYLQLLLPLNVLLTLLSNWSARSSR